MKTYRGTPSPHLYLLQTSKVHSSLVVNPLGEISLPETPLGRCMPRFLSSIFLEHEWEEERADSRQIAHVSQLFYLPQSVTTQPHSFPQCLILPFPSEAVEKHIHHGPRREPHMLVTRASDQGPSALAVYQTLLGKSLRSQHSKTLSHTS